MGIANAPSHLIGDMHARLEFARVPQVDCSGCMERTEMSNKREEIWCVATVVKKNNANRLR